METRIDFGAAPMDVRNLDFYGQWNNHQEDRGEHENGEVCMMNYGGKAKDKGKALRRMGSQDRTVSEAPEMDVRRIGTSVSRMPKRHRQGKERRQGPVRAVTHHQRVLGQGLRQGLHKQRTGLEAVERIHGGRWRRCSRAFPPHRRPRWKRTHTFLLVQVNT